MAVKSHGLPNIKQVVIGKPMKDLRSLNVCE